MCFCIYLFIYIYIYIRCEVLWLIHIFLHMCLFMSYAFLYMFRVLFYLSPYIYICIYIYIYFHVFYICLYTVGIMNISISWASPLWRIYESEDTINYNTYICCGNLKNTTSASTINFPERSPQLNTDSHQGKTVLGAIKSLIRQFCATPAANWTQLEAGPVCKGPGAWGPVSCLRYVF